MVLTINPGGHSVRGLEANKYLRRPVQGSRRSSAREGMSPGLDAAGDSRPNASLEHGPAQQVVLRKRAVSDLGLVYRLRPGRFRLLHRLRARRIFAYQRIEPAVSLMRTGLQNAEPERSGCKLRPLGQSDRAFLFEDVAAVEGMADLERLSANSSLGGGEANENSRPCRSFVDACRSARPLSYS